MEIYLLRHGIAEDGVAGQSDRDRALTAEGKRRLRETIRVAKEAGVVPSLVLTSPLKRAIETAQIAVSGLGYSGNTLRTKALIPEASVEELWDEIRIHKEEESLLLVSHQPLMGLALGHLLGAPAIQVDFKKGALARVDVDRFGPQPRGVLKFLLTSKLVG